jgi:pimeloyl-ACP methyl ester carboxylesterase
MKRLFYVICAKVAMRHAQGMKDHIRLLSLSLAALGLRLFSNAAPAIAGRCAAFIWFTPLRKAPGPRQAELVASSSVTVVENLKLRSWGPQDGLRVVFVHGWGGRWDQGEALIRALVAEGCRVSAFDFAGHGESPGLSTDIAQWIDWLATADFGPAPVFICHSFGFTAVSNAVLRRNMPARGVVAINPPLGFPFFIEAFRRRARLSLKVVPHLIRLIERRVPQVRTLTSVPIEDLSGRVPLLYVADRNDREVPFAMHRQAMEILGERFVATDGTGHNRILASARLIEVVSGLVTEVQGDHSRFRAKACPEPVLR